MAAPQNAAVLNAAQEGPAAAQAAQAAAFAAEVTRREEHVDTAQKAKGGRVEPRGERENQPQDQRRQRKFLPNPSDVEDEPANFYGLSDGEHFIDVTV